MPPEAGEEPCLVPTAPRYLHEEGGGSDLVLLVASLQERDEQVKDATELLAGVMHHGPGGEGGQAVP